MIPKFKACDKYHEMMVSIISIDFENKIAYVEQENGDRYDIHFDNLIFLQSTGLEDKNGVEIYEGHICECIDGLKNYWYVIEWIYAGWQVVTYKKPHTNIRGISDGTNQAYLEPDYSSQLKIIGNIYENPELLEVENSDTAI